MRGRTRWIVLGAVAVLGLAAVGALRYVIHLNLSPEAQIRDTALADATKKVDEVLARFDYDHLSKAGDYRHSAGQHPDVQVVSVTGQTHWQTGVTLVLKVTGHGVVTGANGSVIGERDVPICFRLQLGPHDDSREDDIDCPAATPVPVAQDPSLHGIDDRLRHVLDSAGPNEPAVRAAVAGLNLDPAIREDVVARDGVIGVALRASQYDCVIARVTSKGAQLWRPSHTQLAPGELSCSAQIALSSVFGTYPH